MSTTLKVDSYKVIGLNSHHILVEKDKKVQQVTLDGKTFEVKLERTLTLNSDTENRIGFSDKIAIDSIEECGSYGFATEIKMTLGSGQP